MYDTSLTDMGDNRMTIGGAIAPYDGPVGNRISVVMIPDGMALSNRDVFGVMDNTWDANDLSITLSVTADEASLP